MKDLSLMSTLPDSMLLAFQILKKGFLILDETAFYFLRKSSWIQIALLLMLDEYALDFTRNNS